MSLALVTGAAGFLGSHLVEALLADGWAVRALDDGSTGRAENLAAVRERIVWQAGDVRDAAVLAGLAEGADVIFHLAARSSKDGGFEDPVGSHAVNAEGTLAVLEAARAAGVRRVVHASSWQVYGERPEGVLVETLPPAPASPYAVQKLCGEVYCRLYHHLHALETVSLRYFPTFGPRQRPDGGYAAEALLRAGGAPAAEGAEAPELVFVEDAVRATGLAASAERAVGAVVNVGSGLSAGPGSADPSRAKAWLGFEARVPLEEGLERTARWLRGREEGRA